MAMLEAKEVLAELIRLGHDHSPEKQAYKSRIAGHNVTLYDVNGTACVLRAEYTQDYCAKPGPHGEPAFTTEPRAKEAASEDEGKPVDIARPKRGAAGAKAAVGNKGAEAQSAESGGGDGRPDEGSS